MPAPHGASLRHMENRPFRPVFRLAASALVFFFLTYAWPSEDYGAWAHAADLRLDTSPSGAGIGSTVIGFPLLVRLNAANFDFSQAQPGGRDLRFAKPDGTPLPYEIERWDATARAAEAWVRLDTLKGGDASQAVKMYWGNPAAADSSRGPSVFGAANGYAAAWHLGGGGTAARPNAAGGSPAAPVRYAGTEAAAGVIAGADSLDGAAAGGYLDVGSGYAELSGGMTFTVWAYPTAVKAWSHLLDLGNGGDTDNIALGRWDTTSGLSFVNWSGTNHSALNAPGQWAAGQWQMLGVTVQGKSVKLYKDGVPVLADTLAFPIANVARSLCYLGRSNSSRGQYYQGKLDEPELSKAARSADWMKLLYQNQKPGQVIPRVERPAACAWRFGVPGDTSVPEGGGLVLTARAECASSLAWTEVSGPTVRILDPERADLQVALPRVAGDTEMIFRFTAVYADSIRSRDVRVRVREAVPEPAFSLPADSGWDGSAPLAYRPAISNLAALRASPDPALNWSWSFTGPAVDTGWLPDGVLLKRGAVGALGIRLCLDNDGPRICHSGTVRIDGTGPTTGLALPAAAPAAPGLPGRDALGRSALTGAARRLFRAGSIGPGHEAGRP